jgi:hypothetical protein
MLVRIRKILEEYLFTVNSTNVVNVLGKLVSIPQN